jgi:hypothetical protein
MKLRMFVTLACVTGTMAGLGASAQAAQIWPQPSFYTGFAGANNAANGFKSAYIGASGAWSPITSNAQSFDDGSPFADNRLETVVLPAAVTDSTLTTTYKFGLGATNLIDFRLNYDLQTNKDGVVFEQKVDSGPWTDVLVAGGSFNVNGDYDGTINAPTNPLNGRLAWTGSSGGYEHVKLHMGVIHSPGKHYAQFRFRLGTNANIASNFFRLDEFYVNPTSPPQGE